jgi:hypothetical protein
MLSRTYEAFADELSKIAGIQRYKRVRGAFRKKGTQKLEESADAAREKVFRRTHRMSAGTVKPESDVTGGRKYYMEPVEATHDKARAAQKKIKKALKPGMLQRAKAALGL